MVFLMDFAGVSLDVYNGFSWCFARFFGEGITGISPPPFVLHSLASGKWMDMGQTLAVLQNSRMLGRLTETTLFRISFGILAKSRNGNPTTCHGDCRSCPRALELCPIWSLQEGFHNVLKTTGRCKMQRRGGILPGRCCRVSMIGKCGLLGTSSYPLCIFW